MRKIEVAWYSLNGPLCGYLVVVGVDAPLSSHKTDVYLTTQSGVGVNEAEAEC